MITLSVIIPVYNAEKCLRRCVDSIVNQSYRDLEIILVNDGSTDDSLKICREYEMLDSRIHVIDKKNEGAGPTRNAGIKAAQGKYLAFPDSDDRMALDAYEDCIEIMERDQVDLLVFGMKTEVYDDFSARIESIVEDSIPERTCDGQNEFREVWTWLYQNMDMGSPCNKIYRKSIIDEYGIEFPNLRRMQDCVFNLYYADKVCSFKSLNKNYFIRTWHSKEFQRRKMPVNFIECAITHHKTVLEMLRRWGQATPENIAYFAGAFSEIIMTAEEDYLPSETPAFFEIYNHIKKINNHPYVTQFYKDLQTTKKLRKREWLMMRHWNMVLAIDAWMRMRRAK